MPLMRRAGRPGLLGMAARTAVVAGTATAVSGGVARRQQKRANDQNEQQQYEQQQQEYQQQQQQQEYEQQQQYAQAQQTAAQPGPAGDDDMTAQLQRLAALHQQGVLNDAEFTAAKAKLLA